MHSYLICSIYPSVVQAVGDGPLDTEHVPFVGAEHAVHDRLPRRFLLGATEPADQEGHGSDGTQELDLLGEELGYVLVHWNVVAFMLCITSSANSIVVNPWSMIQLIFHAGP